MLMVLITALESDDDKEEIEELGNAILRLSEKHKGLLYILEMNDRSVR